MAADANAPSTRQFSLEAQGALAEFEDFRRRAFDCAEPQAASELSADAARNLAPGQLRQIYRDIQRAGDVGLIDLFRVNGQLWNLLVRHEPPAYETLRLAAGARLYRAQGVSSDRKVLLVVFAGVGGGAFVSTARLLTRLPVGLFDVLWLKPAEGRDYPHGVPGFADSLFNICNGVRRLMPGYGGTAAFGGSLGAYTALRAALLLDLPIGVSLSGRFSQLKWRHGTSDAPVFDPLCSCMRPSGASLIAFHCADNRLDTAQARKLEAMRPDVTVVRLKTDTHNTLAAIMAEGHFDTLFEDIFRRATGDASRPFHDWTEHSSADGGNARFP